jgi:hypothetical protein
MVDDKMGIEKGYETIAPISVLYLIGHSIELSLKSYLLHNGITEKDLRNKYGHNLIKAFDAAKDVGLCELIICDEFEIEVLGYLNTLYQSKQLNYIQTGGKQFPIFGPLQTLATKLLEGISKEVGWRFIR